jgi:hypothetical protein
VLGIGSWASCTSALLLRYIPRPILLFFCSLVSVVGVSAMKFMSVKEGITLFHILTEPWFFLTLYLLCFFCSLLQSKPSLLSSYLWCWLLKQSLPLMVPKYHSPLCHQSPLTKSQVYCVAVMQHSLVILSCPQNTLQPILCGV